MKAAILIMVGVANAAAPVNVHLKPKALAPRAHAEKVTARPDQLISQRTQKVLAELKSRPVTSLNESSREIDIAASATKQSFLSSIYSQRLVEASWATEMLSDKRIMSEVLTRELGREKTQSYYPKTIGLREFLTLHGFITESGEVRKEQAEEIEAALYEEFPAGFIARAAVGVAPSETTKGLFNDTDAFMVELLRPGTPIYRPSHSTAAVSSHLLGTIASGEAVVLQENLTATADAHKALKHKYYQDVRVHTYEGQIIPDSVPSRWVQKELLDSKQIESAEAFVQGFLKTLPVSLTARQAWGIDVAVFDNGEMRINEIITNRGQKVAWSSYLDQPRVIEAYARHFESIAGVRFTGFSGWMIRHGFANYFPYWERRIEKARPGLSKVLAYLPPWP